MSIDDLAGEITLDWNCVATADSYKLFRSTSTATTGNDIYSGSALRYTDTDATTGITYYYRIKACNDDGCSSLSDYSGGLLNGSDDNKSSLTSILQLLLLR